MNDETGYGSRISGLGSPPAARSALSGIFSAVVFVAILALQGCGTPPQRTTHVVKAGETLYSIAKHYDLDYRELAKLNGVERDFRIHTGQVLRLNGRAAHVRATPSPSAPSRAPPRPARAPAPTGPLPTLAWKWPVDGGAVAVTDRPSGGQGMTISGEIGRPIRAAADGKVVYTGSGLRGYGQLVVIQHPPPFLSAYGYTDTLLVHEGDVVHAGQQIATMGAASAHESQLYFEIRVSGKPVDPRRFLPKR